jgi:hypothetical protein
VRSCADCSLVAASDGGVAGFGGGGLFDLLMRMSRSCAVGPSTGLGWVAAQVVTRIAMSRAGDVLNNQ